MIALAPLIGVLLLVALLADVHATVFIPRGRGGPISRRLYAFVWAGWRRWGDRLSAERRRGWLAFLGPLLAPLTILVWAGLLVTGCALIYAPWAATFAVSPAASGPVPAWAAALYYSAYASTTLGVGDVVPQGAALRLVAAAEAGLGLVLVTSAVTYLLSVYAALNRVTALALAISRFIGRRDGAEPVDALVAMARGGAEEDVRDWLGRTGADLVGIVQAEGQYPLLHYFHEPNDDRALPVALADLLEVATLCRALLAPERFPALAEGPASAAVMRIGQHYLTETQTKGEGDEGGLEEERRRRYEAARARLMAAGVPLREDGEAWRTYAELRAGWDAADERVRAYLGYPEGRNHP